MDKTPDPYTTSPRRNPARYLGALIGAFVGLGVLVTLGTGFAILYAPAPVALLVGAVCGVIAARLAGQYTDER